MLNTSHQKKKEFSLKCLKIFWFNTLNWEQNKYKLKPFNKKKARVPNFLYHLSELPRPSERIVDAVKILSQSSRRADEKNVFKVTAVGLQTT